MMNVSFAVCFSVSRRPMCWTIGSSTCSRGSVTLRWRPSERSGSWKPVSAASSFAHAPAALTSRWARMRPAAVVTVKRVAPPSRIHVDGRSHLRASGSRRLPRRREARRAARRERGRRDPPAGRRRRPWRSVARYGAKLRRSSPSKISMSSPASSSITRFSCRSRSWSSVSATIKPAGEVDVECGRRARARAPSRPLPPRVQPHLGLQALAHVLGLGSRQLVNRDLEVEASGIRPGRLAVQLAALDEHDLDALDVPGSRRAPCRRGRRRRRATSVLSGSGRASSLCGQPAPGGEIVGVVAQVSHE